MTQILSPRCTATVGQWPDRRTCWNPAKVVRNGTSYCGACDPVAAGERQDRRDAKRRAARQEAEAQARRAAVRSHAIHLGLGTETPAAEVYRVALRDLVHRLPDLPGGDVCVRAVLDALAGDEALKAAFLRTLETLDAARQGD